MAEIKLGRIVFSERGYMVAEVLEAGPQGTVLTGYTLVGPDASGSIIYATRYEALEALSDIEARGADD